jgi:hypothetical protein
MKTLTAKQILNRNKSNLKKWGTKVTTKRVTEDPEGYEAIATVVLFDTVRTSYGFGETRKEARSVALYDLSLRVFHGLTS